MDKEMMNNVEGIDEDNFITLTDEKSGEFCYTPADDYVGNDSFKYVVYDKYGNYRILYSMAYA